MSRLHTRHFRSITPPVPLSVYQLHELRPSFYDPRKASLRSREYEHASIFDVQALPLRIRRSARPPLSCTAQRLSGLRSSGGTLGCSRGADHLSRGGGSPVYGRAEKWNDRC